LATKEAAPAPVPRGLFLDGYRQMVFNPARVMQDFKINKKNMTDTTIHLMGDPKCLLPSTDLRLPRLRS
jgi:hypothetical protein